MGPTDSGPQTVQMNVMLGGMWLHLGTAVIEHVEGGETILHDYIPAKPLAAQREEASNEVHDHLDATRAAAEGEDQQDAGPSVSDPGGYSAEEAGVLDRVPTDWPGDEDESERPRNVSGQPSQEHWKRPRG